MELLPEVRGARLLCASAGRGQLALAAARADPARQVSCPFLDLHLAGSARAAAGAIPPNLAIECVADWPAGPFDAALIPLRAGGDSEVAWELLQAAHCALPIGGRLLASVDEPRDHWVAGRMEALFGKRFVRHPGNDAVAYSGVKRDELAKRKGFECEFAFRDRGRLIRAVSRPGVFSHRKLDLGARALIESLAEPTEGEGGGGGARDLVAAGARILDLGCGSGAVGFAAALRAGDASVHAVDSMPRALDCALRGAALNGLARYAVQLEAEGAIDAIGAFDLVLANPPYYSRHRIAEVFVRATLRALAPGGRVHLVTRQPEWFVERLRGELEGVRVRMLRGYAVVDGARRAPA